MGSVVLAHQRPLAGFFAEVVAEPSSSPYTAPLGVAAKAD